MKTIVGGDKVGGGGDSGGDGGGDGGGGDMTGKMI